MDIFDILEKIFTSIIHLNYLHIFLIVFIIFVIGLLILISFSSKQNRIKYYNYVLRKIIKLLQWLRKYIEPIFNAINPYPFQSVLLQVTILYLIIFTIFIRHPWHILKKWPKTTDTILVSGLVFLLVTLFIEFNVPFRGSGNKRQGSISHLMNNYGKYIGLLFSICVIVLLGVIVSYLATKHTTIAYIIYSLAMFGIIFSLASMLYTLFRDYLPPNFPSPTKIVQAILFVIPMLIFNAIVNDISNTPTSMLILAFVEIIFILGFFVIPIIINYLYLTNPRNKDHIKLMKIRIKAVENSIETEKNTLKKMTGGIDIKWRSVPKLEDRDVKLLLFDAGYTTTNVDRTLRFVRENEKAVVMTMDKIHKLKKELKILQKELKRDKDYSASILLRDPVFTDKRRTLGTFENLRKGNDYEYQYTLSCWLFLHNQAPNHSYAYNKFTSLLNYGNKPNITYNVKKQTLRITMLSGKTKQKVVYETRDFPLQKWNNIVINYDHGTMDIFVNARLVSSIPGIVPYMQHDDVVSGENDGISGGICNVVYYSGNLTIDRIKAFYKLLKNKNPPLFWSPLYYIYKHVISKIEYLYNEHNWPMLILILIMVYLGLGSSLGKYNMQSLTNTFRTTTTRRRVQRIPYNLRYRIEV